MSLLKEKIGLIFGVANRRSIAWAIAESCHQAGASLAFTYQGDRLKDNVERLTSNWEKTLLMPCDVRSDTDISRVFKQVKDHYEGLDFLIHSIAFAPKSALEGGFVETTRDAFQVALDISVFSLVAVAKEAKTLMNKGGSIISMSYYGAEKVIPNYNVMGVAKAALEASTRYLAKDLGPQKIRVNCISAGPVNTLAARGISGFSEMLKHHSERAPLGRNITPAELGATAVFLSNEGSAAITGQVIYVDSGYQIMGM